MPATAPASPPAATLSRRAKAAIVVRMMLDAGVPLPLDQLPVTVQSDLTTELGGLRYVDGGTLREVAGEFLGAMERAGMSFPGGIDGALSLLDGHISQDAAERLRLGGRPRPDDPWSHICDLPVDRLAALTDGEAVEVAAVVLSKLPTSRAAEVLGKLPGDRARRIACAISGTASVPPDTVARIGRALKDQIASTPDTAFAEPPAKRIGAILNAAPSRTRNDMLAALDQENPTLAQDVRKSILTFEDLPTRLEPRDVPSILRGVEQDVILRALGISDGAAAVTAEFLLENMSRRLADQIRADIEDQPAPTPEEAEAAQGQIVAALRDMMDRGEITLIAKPAAAA